MTGVQPYVKRDSRKEALVAGVWIVHLSAMAGITSGNAEWFTSKTPFSLLLLFVSLVLIYPVRGFQNWFLFLLVFSMGILAEWIGVHSGILFGSYHYGDNLGPLLAGVPVLIGVNWAILLFITAEISRLTSEKMWFRVLVGAGLMVFLDIFIEPVASGMGFWYWESDIVPYYNFLCWFVLSLFMHIIAQAMKLKGDSWLSLHLYAVQLFFFGFLYVIYKV